MLLYHQPLIFISLRIKGNCNYNKELYPFSQLISPLEARLNIWHYVCFIDENITFAKLFKPLIGLAKYN